MSLTLILLPYLKRMLLRSIARPCKKKNKKGKEEGRLTRNSAKIMGKI
jgi:hypothetical protein